MEARTLEHFLFGFIFKVELAIEFGASQKKTRLTQPSKHKCYFYLSSFVCLFFFPCDFWSVGNFKVLLKM